MDYKGYHIEEEQPGEFVIYGNYDDWRDSKEPIHTAGSLNEAEQWVDDIPHPINIEIEYSFSQRPDEDIPLVKIVRVEALVAGEPVGIVAGRISPSTESGSIMAITVDEKFRRRGVGTGLLDKILEKYRSEGVKRVAAVWPSEEGEKLLLKYGFRWEDSEALVFDMP